MPDHDASRDRTASALVTSDRVEGTPVFGADRTQVGAIDHLIIDKLSGRVVYAVMSFGGILGLGQDVHPIPWAALHYDTGLGGYLTEITEAQLKGAPARPADGSRDRAWEEQAHAHFGLPYYWI